MKYLSAFLASILVFAVSVSPTFAQETLGWPFLLIEQADGSMEYYMGDTPIIDYIDNEYIPDAENEGYPVLTLYIHEDCGHCKIVEAHLDETDQWDLVEKKELKNNEENMAEIDAVWAELTGASADTKENSPNYVLLGAGVFMIIAILVYGVVSIFSKEE